MRFFGRLIFALACGALTLQPAAALATPSPSPGLSGILAPPPTADYVEADATAPGVVEGQFDAKTFASRSGHGNVAGIQQTLERDGFLDGYGRTWVQKVSRRVLVEFVMAFTGGVGANKWLSGSELADKADPNYQHPISVTGIASYYGARFFYSSNHAYEDAYVFVKGNDFFIVAALSANDDLGNVAADQTKVQYSTAPDATIPQSQWPQSTSVTAAYNAGSFLGVVIVLALLAGIVLFVVGLVRRSRRQTAFVGALPGAISGSGIQLSPDGRYWWDGQSWRDAQVEVPPSAQRSPDGHFWWDGRQWRPLA
jgi:hypothetical protein